jgi:TRAP-type C4-dicarboxylate transport system permease large subunit
MVPIACVACTVGANWLIYSVAAGESLSVAGLLLAGIVPAILLGGAMLTFCWFAARWKGYSLTPRDLSFRMVARESPRVCLLLLLPFVIVAGLAGGMLTAKQAGVLAIAHTLLCGFSVMKDVRGRGLSRALLYAGLLILVPFTLPLVTAVGFVHFPEVFVWLPKLFGY